MRTFLFSAILALLASLAFTPLVLRFALRLGMVEEPDQEGRKVHVRAVPRLGGIAIVAAFATPIFAIYLLESDVWRQFSAEPRQLIGILGGGLVIAGLGLYDDLRGASAKIKLAVQLGTALALYWIGFRIDAVDLPFLPPIELGWFGLLLTVGWIVGITNAVNLIDGLDGLAAGLALLGLAPVVIKGILLGNIELGLIGCCLVGSLLGFMVYNFHPAKIFMGDTGSMFLGFMLSVVTVQSAQKGPAAVSMLVPILALGLPIMDTLLAIARRAWLGNPIFGADRGHIHHRLLDAGLSHRRVVLVMYLTSAAFVVAAVSVQLVRDPVQATILVLCLTVAALLMRRIGYLGGLDPRRLGSGLRGAAALRAENQLLRRRVDAFLTDVQAGLKAPQVISRLGSLLGEMRVLEARLVLLPSEGAANPEQTWHWKPTSDLPSATVEHTFPLGQGGATGRIEVRWPVLPTLWQVQAPLVEAVARGLAEARTDLTLRGASRPGDQDLSIEQVG